MVTSSFTINCTSMGSPPSAVSWTKDGVQLSSSAVYSMEQRMQHGPTATYVNLLSVNTGPYGVLGTYICNVSNILGSTVANISFEGMPQAHQVPRCALILHPRHSLHQNTPFHI